jgi:hypothetical protein
MAAGIMRATVLEALGFLLEPVVLLLLKNGVTWSEFSVVAKAAFVNVATRQFGIRGRPTNISRVAILTGLDHREVRRIRCQLERPATPHPACKPSQVLEGWFGDPDFVDDAGQPRDLELRGEAGSFELLARRYAPAIPHIAMIKQLVSVGAVQELADKRVRVLKRAYVPRALSEDHIASWGSVLHDIGATWEHNLMRDASQRSRFEQRAVNLHVDRTALPAFQEFLEAEGHAFLERVDAWLDTHQVASDEVSTARRIRLGVGVYHIGDDRVAATGTTRTLTGADISRGDSRVPIPRSS